MTLYEQLLLFSSTYKNWASKISNFVYGCKYKKIKWTINMRDIQLFLTALLSTYRL